MAHQPPRKLRAVPPSETSHLSFALGVALGRFGAAGEGISRPTHLPPRCRTGILFLSDASDDDSLAHPATAPILAAWADARRRDRRQAHAQELPAGQVLPRRAPQDVREPADLLPALLGEEGFVAFVSIHRWTREHAQRPARRAPVPGQEAARRRVSRPARRARRRRQEGERRRPRSASATSRKWLEELTDFIANVEQCAEKGPPPPDAKTTPREVDARYAPDLDDGVMINSAALWPLLEPQWKDPKKWWKELANAEGKKDYDWSHLATRYFPDARRREVQDRSRASPSPTAASGSTTRPRRTVGAAAAGRDPPRLHARRGRLRRRPRRVRGRAPRRGRGRSSPRSTCAVSARRPRPARPPPRTTTRPRPRAASASTPTTAPATTTTRRRSTHDLHAGLQPV